MKKILVIVLAVILTLTLLLTGVTFADQGHKEVDYIYWWGYPVGQHVSNWLEMNYSCVTGVRHPTDKCWCGPSSGISIGWYYKNRPLSVYGNNYQYLPSTKPKMYDDLYDYMDTTIFGSTDWHDYGPGFVEMALHYGYDNFSYVYYGPDSDEGPVDADFFWVIEEAIDNGWPVALFAIQALEGFKGVEALPGSDGDGSWPCEVWHVIAIKGYSYSESFLSPGYTYDLRIRCTDNYSHASNLWLYWDDVITEVGETYLRAVIIKDVDTPDPYGPYVEDFEWGTDGASLEDWQSYGGEVDWEVRGTSGDSGVEIDTAEAHTGTRSARFYRDTIGTLAYYSLLQPSSIGFWLKKGDTASAEFRIGDGDNAIWVQVNSAEQLRYYDTSWHTVSGLSLNWNHIEFRNIDWGEQTFDIYVNNYCPPGGEGAGMRQYPSYNGLFYILSQVGSQSEFWIDDITDSLVQPD